MEFSLKLAQTVSDLLGKKELSDITVLLEDGHRISAHKLVLFVRSKSWNLDDFIHAEYLDLSAYSFSVMIIMLNWVYTDNIDTESITSEYLRELLNFAKTYQLNALYERCMTEVNSKEKDIHQTEVSHSMVQDQSRIPSDNSLIFAQPNEDSSNMEQTDIEESLNDDIELHSVSFTEKDIHCENQEILISSVKNDSETDRDRKFPCWICSKAFLCKSHLKDHMVTHTGLKTLTCQICGKSFNRKSSLKRHANVHTQEKEFDCDICLKSFVNTGSLMKHKKIHSGKKQHKCHICTKSFCESSNLKRHIRTHTGEKPYTCPDCDQSFSDSSALLRHRRKHSKVKEYFCHHCNVDFQTMKKLRKHLDICKMPALKSKEEIKSIILSEDSCVEVELKPI